MDAYAKRVVKKPSGSSFDTTLEETLKALYERRLKVISLLRSLETQKREKPERKLKANEATY